MFFWLAEHWINCFESICNSFGMLIITIYKVSLCSTLVFQKERLEREAEIRRVREELLQQAKQNDSLA